MFANLAKLREAGVDPASLKTFADFDKALADGQVVAAGDEPAIMLGNKEQYPVIHMWGTLQGAYEPAQEVRDWIFHRPGKTFDTEGNRASLEKLAAWNNAGLHGRRATTTTAVASSRRGQPVRAGDGAFMLGGNWNAQTSSTASARTRRSSTCRPARPASAPRSARRACRSTCRPRRKQPDLAAAYINFIAGRDASQPMVDNSMVPAVVDPTAEPRQPFAREIADGLAGAPRRRRADAVPRLVVADDARDHGPVLPGAARRARLGRGRHGRVQEDWDGYDEELGGS